MAQLAISAVGLGVGALFGNPALGWAVGSALGGALFAETQRTEGPRLGDLSVQSSAYGLHIPKLYGIYRAAGNIIDATPILETRHKEKADGKGGGGSEAISYTYSVSCAVGISEGPISGIRKIWADGKLIYNSGTADAAGLFASTARANSIRVYSGDETQEPDSLFETRAGGEGEYPAYRGLAYIVFDNLQLADFANRIPNFSFEVISDGTIQAYTKLNDHTNLVNLPCPWVFGNFGVYGCELVNGVVLFNAGISDDFTLGNRHGAVQVDVAGNVLSIGSPTIKFGRGTFSGGVFGKPGNAQTCSGRVGGRYLWFFSGTSSGFNTIGHSAMFFTARGATTIVVTDFANNKRLIENQYISGSDFQANGDRMYGFAAQAAGGAAWCLVSRYLDGVQSGNFLQHFDSDLDLVEEFEIDVTAGTIWFKGDYNLGDNGLFPGTISGSSFAVESDGIHFWVISGASVLLYELDPLDFASGNPFTLLKTFGLGTGPLGGDEFLVNGDARYPVADNGFFAAVCTDEVACSTAGTANDQLAVLQVIRMTTMTRLGVVSVTSTSLASIVSDIVLKDPRYTAADIDVTDLLLDTVDGYSRTGIMSMRRALEPLQQAFFFDIIESDFKLKFVKRGGRTPTELSFDDFGAGLDQPPAQKLTITRDEELELPGISYVTYIAANRDYQQSTQPSERLQTDVIGVADSSLPIVLSDDRGKQIANVLLYDQWSRRDSFNFSLSTKHSGIEPTDLVRFTARGILYLVRIINVQRATGNVLEITAVKENLSGYNSAALGQSVDVEQPNINFAGGTALSLLDLPLLRQVDDSPGLYYAVNGSYSGWTGANIHRSKDGGETFNLEQSAFDESVTGVCQTALLDHTHYTIDDINTVRVNVADQTLNNASNINAVRGATENTAAIGQNGAWEIVSYQNATLISSGVYDLTNIVRGRYGSFINSGDHSSNDLFILLDPDIILRIQLGYEDVDLDLLFRAVSFGGVAQAALSVPNTYTAQALRPLKPSLPKIRSNTASTGIALTWIRADRFAFDLVNSGIGETISEGNDAGVRIEEWEIDIIDVSAGNAVLATYNSVTDISLFTTFFDNAKKPSFQYSDAQKSTDGAVPGDLFRIYHISPKLRDNTSQDGRGDFLEVAMP